MLKRAVLMFFILSLPALGMFTLSSLAQGEQITITTYYPSPVGVYNELRAKRMAVGDNYYDASSYSWGSNVDANADLVVEGRVGIGTSTPQSVLHVVATPGVFPSPSDIISGDNSVGQLNVRIGVNAIGAYRGLNPSDLALNPYGANVGIGTSSPQQPAPNGNSGNLDVNDIYLRSTGKWMSLSSLPTSYYNSCYSGVNNSSGCTVACNAGDIRVGCSGTCKDTTDSDIGEFNIRPSGANGCSCSGDDTLYCYVYCLHF